MLKPVAEVAVGDMGLKHRFAWSRISCSLEKSNNAGYYYFSDGSALYGTNRMYPLSYFGNGRSKSMRKLLRKYLCIVSDECVLVPK